MKPRLASILIILCSHLAFCQNVPSLINYQGRLTDKTGRALAAGAYGIQFKLWDDPLAGSLIWAQQQSVAIQSNGVFNAILGSSGGTSISGAAVNDLSFAFNMTNRYLGVTVVSQNGTSIANPNEILPRQQLLSTPFAVESQRAGTLRQAYADTLSPPGSIIAFGGSATPDGWLLCDGTAESSVKYPRLFVAISTNWGTGDSGTNDFNLPDLRGLFLRGVNGTRTNEFADPDIAEHKRNNAVGSLQKDMFASHKHRPLDYPSIQNIGALAGTQLYPPAAGGINNTPDTGAAGGNETRPKNAYVNYLIKY